MDDEEADENFPAQIWHRYVYGSLTLAIYLSPCFWIKYLYSHFISEDNANDIYKDFILPVELQQ